MTITQGSPITRPSDRQSAPDLSAPGFAASKATLAKLRERRRVRRMARMLVSGEWRAVLLGMQQTQHKFKEVRGHSGKIAELLVKVNLIDLAVKIHGTVLAGNPASFSLPETFDAQSSAISEIKNRCLFDTLLINTVRRANAESEAVLRVDTMADVPGKPGGAVLCLDNNDQTIPIGPIGPDGQPTVWERRWVVERGEQASATKKQRYLRVERHAAPGGEGMVEQEAFETDSTDVLKDLTELSRVPLARVGVELDDVRMTGVAHPLVTRFVADTDTVLGEPSWMVSPGDMDLIDTVAAAFSRLARTHELHAAPRLKVTADAVDRVEKRVSMDDDAIFGEASYLDGGARLAEMLAFLDRMMDWQLIRLQVSKALLGFKPGGGSSPDSYDKLRLESTHTLSRAHTAAMYVTPALGRAMTLATHVDSLLPGSRLSGCARLCAVAA